MHPINSTVNGYNIDKALKLLSARDFNAYRPKGGCRHIANLVYNIGVTLLRILNVIFGDHKWYNNATALRIVTRYFNQIEPNPQMTDRIDNLFQQLSFRRQGRANHSYTQGLDLNNLHNQQRRLGFIPLDDEEQDPPDNPDPTTEERVVMPEDGFFKDDKGKLSETGNLDLLHTARQCLAQRFSNGEIKDILTATKDSLNQYKPELPDDNPQLLLEILAPRKLQPAPFVAPDEEQTAPSQDPQIQGFKDPSDLFAYSIRKAMQELNIRESRWRDPSFTTSPEMRKACQWAIFHLLRQAEFKNDSCHGIYIELNAYLNTSYQKPSLAYIRNEEGIFEEKIIYGTDLLSDRDTGCDPEIAKQLIDAIQNPRPFLNAIKLNPSRNNQLNTPPTLQENDGILYELIDTMASQIQKRYIPAISKIIRDGREPQPTLETATSFNDYISKARTPYALLSRAFTWTMQDFASKGFIKDDDYMNPDLADVNGPHDLLNCKATILHLVAGAQVTNAFEVKLTPRISQTVGTYFVFEPKATLHHTPYLLGGNSSANVDQPATDLIALKSYLEEMTEEEKGLLKQLILAPLLQKFCEAHEITDPTVLNSLKFRERLENLKNRQPGRHTLLLKADDQISKMATFVNANYFKNILPDVLNAVTFRDNIITRPMEFHQERSGTIDQAVMLTYIPQEVQNQVVIKQRPLRTTPPSIRVTQEEIIPGLRTESLGRQNKILSNGARCGNCMYGALAIEIFGNSANTNIERYAGIVRRIVANYLREHKTEYEALINTSVRNSGLPEVSFDAYCNKVENNTGSLEWGGDIQMGVIAQVFGVRIDIFDIQQGFRVKDGEILPNVQLGHRFEGAPIRLTYNGAHYQPLEMR